ncbi:hypothetical protein N1851_017614 [Merluccius polli]|uniref:Uncharacterized protein n=1 Tax=Merluccius polli TaxID=89951 RepID=A0AA47MPU3_MERPO|nr:hypothetical protein N1851_017614 [Merluccius polli]
MAAVPAAVPAAFPPPTPCEHRGGHEVVSSSSSTSSSVARGPPASRAPGEANTATLLHPGPQRSVQKKCCLAKPTVFESNQNYQLKKLCSLFG